MHQVFQLRTAAIGIGRAIEQDVRPLQQAQADAGGRFAVSRVEDVGA